MSQNDYTIANQGFPAFRADLNSALQAIATNNSGATAPSTTFANMWWYDSANNILYIRNEDNDAWIKFAELDQTNDKFILSGTLQLDDGTVSAPALTFNSDTNMGIYRGGTDILKFVTAGTDAITIDASQNVAIGQSDVRAKLSIGKAKSGTGVESVNLLSLEPTGTFAIGDTANINFHRAGTTTARISGYYGDDDVSYGELVFSTRRYTTDALNEGFRLDNRGRIGIGTSSPTRKVQIVDSSATPYLSIVGPNGSGAGIMLGDTDDESVGRITYDNSVNNLQFWTNDEEQVRIHSNGVLSASHGIALGVGTANTASNVLDDYEEGTWTPALGGTTTYSGQSGHYTKVGNLVHVTGQIAVTLIGTGSTNIISGLPFTSATTINGSTPGVLGVSYYANFSIVIIWVSGYVSSASTSIAITGNTVSNSTIQHNSVAFLQNSTRIDFNMTYYVS